jgi:kynureninase
VFCDWRFPNVIRVAPTPLFNTYSDIRRFVDILATAIAANRST